MEAKRLILVSSTSHPLDKVFEEIADEISQERGIKKERKEEDYSFLSDYGEKDEYNMPWLPQLLVEFDDGSIKPILTRAIIDENSYKPDKDLMKKEALNKIKKLSDKKEGSDNA
ncbi:hypothetical protein HS7_08640 [Sulfolobales archaeon HS-7]|nr:hypothetical protein HS7_08640 [Sulfolobales archaeon HS-7]